MHNNITGPRKRRAAEVGRKKKKQPVRKEKFSCVEGCSDCCIYREYYPSTDFGKIGVLLLPEEKGRMEKLAREKEVEIKILPRLGVGRSSTGPEKIIAYQMMGRHEKDGDWCPFLDHYRRSPHGGFACSIYAQRPLACSAYPVIGADKKKGATLDPHCQFCRHRPDSSMCTSLEGLQGELESLSKIKAAVRVEDDDMRVWRYATATGEKAALGEGWILES
ncbi:MAG TPA: YkgJ family cysteine cluster protein [Nitrososphaera sp.]|nr:YkgJ family cysteine cluster protein [Nitrososphaera sp.]